MIKLPPKSDEIMLGILFLGPGQLVSFSAVPTLYMLLSCEAENSCILLSPKDFPLEFLQPVVQWLLDAIGPLGTSAALAAQRFECPFTRVPFDMTRVIWVLTANDIDRISAPLRDRCLVFNLPGITPATAALFFDYLVREIDNIEELKAEASAFVAKCPSSGFLAPRAA